MRPTWRRTLPWSHEMCSWYSRSPRTLTTANIGISTRLLVGGMPGRLWMVIMVQRALSFSKSWY